MTNEQILKQLNSSSIKLEVKNAYPVIIRFKKPLKEITDLPANAEKTTRSAVVFHDCNTGEEYYFLNDITSMYGANYVVVDRSNLCEYRLNYEYISDIECLAVSLCTFNFNTPSPGEKREWKITSSFLLTKRKTLICYNKKEGVYFDYLLSKDLYNKIPFSLNYKDLNGSEKVDCLHYYSAQLENEFKKLFPFINMGGNNFNFVNNTYNLECFLRYNEPVKKMDLSKVKLMNWFRYHFLKYQYLILMYQSPYTCYFSDG